MASPHSLFLRARPAEIFKSRRDHRLFGKGGQAEESLWGVTDSIGIGEGYAFNRYLGRAPGTIAERHYIAVGSKLVELLREQVTRRIDEVLKPDHAGWTRLAGKVIQLRAV